jgi:hypothetical protein
MTSVWLGAISSLSGVLIGAFATYFSQKGIWKRTTRRELYGNLVGKSNICQEQLLDVAFAIRQKQASHGRNSRWEDQLNARWEKANVGMAEVSSLAAQVSMVATTSTRAAANALEKNLSDLKTKLYRHNKNRTEPASGDRYRAAFKPVQEDFIEAASRELRIARIKSSRTHIMSP